MLLALHAFFPIVFGVCAPKIGNILAAAWDSVITDKVTSPLLLDICIFTVLRIALPWLGVSYESFVTL